MVDRMQRAVCAGTFTLTYKWEKKRVKNINLRVRQDGSVFVSSAPWVPAGEVDRFVLSRAEMIAKAQRQFIDRRPEPVVTLTEGAEIPCLGKLLTLHIAAGEKDCASLSGDTLILALRKPDDPKAAERLFARWWDATCAELFSALCRTWYGHFSRWDIPFPTLRFRHMSSRWGSCQPQTGVITLNKRLLHAPLACIEYIIVHELAHLVQANHSPAFHAVVTEVMPDWKKRRKLLLDSVIPQ